MAARLRGDDFHLASRAKRIREDEFTIDFTNPRPFVIEIWKTASESHRLSDADQDLVQGMTDEKSWEEYVRTKFKEARGPTRSAMSQILQLYRPMFQFATMIQEVERDLEDIAEDVDVSPIWSMSYLNVMLSLDSKSQFVPKLKRTASWMTELRRQIELLLSFMDQAGEDGKTMRIEMSQVFEPILGILHDSIVYLQRYPSDDEFVQNYHSNMQPKLKVYLGEIEETVKHISAMVRSRRINQQQESRFGEVGIREREYPMDGVEKALFPVDNMPTHKTRFFAGRSAEIERIHQCLGTQANTRLQTYLIYGRRGIGKTQIALEYFAKHKSSYDAVFWIACETGASLRQSFAEIATALELDGADRNGHFEENLMKVLRWLRHTRKRWLLIYDNAERENLLKGFWPVGTRGSILLTSRTYYNFFEDDQRQGETVPLFSEQESHSLLMAQLGSAWESTHFGSHNVMCDVEKAAARTLLEKTGGLPLAINHAAKLILNTKIGMKRAGGRGDDTIHGFLELFGESSERLPPRQTGDRHPLIKSLDTIWSIAFDALSANARALLSVLALVSPDVIFIDIFMPGDLDRLTPKLAFCRADISEAANRPSIQLASRMGSRELQQAIDELENQGMITRNGRNLAIHREVQEAVNYQTRDDLRESFDAAVNLLYDAFPQQRDGRPMTEDRDSCRRWIQHVIALANKYDVYAVGRPENDEPLKGMASADILVKLLANCAWYLFEIADYDECLNIIRTARAACEDPTSLDFAHLLNTEGTTYFELNKLRPSRDACEAARMIRETKLESQSAEMAIVLANLGNVESAQGNLEEALDLLTQAARIREEIGDDAAVMLALNYLQIGRVYFLQGEYTRAYVEYQRCEGVFLKKAGRNGWFLADLYYAYGNLEFAQNDFVQAGRSYERARRVCMDYNPLHPLTAAVFYKIACTEFEQDHHTKSLGQIEKAMNIAEVRSAHTIDGTLARIIWKKGQIMMDDELTGNVKREEARASMNEMELRQREIAETMDLDLRGFENDEDREPSFDLLVAGYYR